MGYFGFTSRVEFNLFRVIGVIRGSVFRLQRTDPRNPRNTRNVSSSVGTIPANSQWMRCGRRLYSGRMVSRNSLLTGRCDHAPNAIGMFPTIEGNVTSDDYPGDFFGIVLVLFGI